MSRRKILFVDGEEGILSGLKRMLRPLRDDWDMRFFSSPERALDAAANEKFDLVVSEIRVPGMDGMSFLDEIRRRHPEIVRVVMSGDKRQVTKLRSTGVVHQSVEKPCRADTLERTVNRAGALRRDLQAPGLVATISNTKSLPSAPTLYHQLMEELRSDDASLARVGSIVSKDPAMTARVLQIVNSAFFGLRRRVADIGQAVTLLGIDTISSLVISLHVFRQHRLPPDQMVLIEGLWERSLSVAHLAKAIMKMDVATRGIAEEAYLAGILHDAGKLVFADNWPEEFTRVERGGAAIGAERAAFGADHAFVGAYLLALWGLPDDIVEAVAYHHQPSLCEAGGSPVLAAVHAAHAISVRPDPLTTPVFDQAFLESTGLSGRVEQWIALADDMAFQRQYA